MHVFNPETDYANGCGGGNYNPPASVVQLRKSMALFPATYAYNGDTILLLDNLTEEELHGLQYYDTVIKKDIRIIDSGSGLKRILDTAGGNPDEKIEILPWGWNHTLRNTLLRHGMPAKLMKAPAEIETIRNLSHRRTTIPFTREIARLSPSINFRIPKEFNNLDEALTYAYENPGCYFKMPWSSSGRGVICATGISEQKLQEWLKGAIAKQGSVMGEYGYDRVADFATEWICSDGEIEFVGLSWFDTNDNGKFLGNQHLSQEEIRKRIEAVSPHFNDKLIEAQKETIGKLIAPHYNGPLGIDMLADKQGNINPCVEINLRMTMGMATILGNI